MTDFHSHILPGVDAGSRDAEQSVRMLEILKKCGFDDVVLSPHFYSHRESSEDFLARREQGKARLSSVLSDKLPRLYYGAEVYLSTLLFNCMDLKELTVDGTHMLLELPYEKELTETTRKNVERLIYHRDICPVLAHIERYPFLMNEKELLNFLDMGCRVQMNMGVFSDKQLRRKLKKYINEGYVSTFGSDAHSDVELEAKLTDNISNAAKLFGKDFLDGIGSFAKETLLCLNSKT